MAANKPKKKQALRNNEYYSTQEIFDDLYQQSQDGVCFSHLMELITSEQNIPLAYRAIKKNKGSKTKGVNSTTIIEIGETQPEELIATMVTPPKKGEMTVLCSGPHLSYNGREPD